MKSLLALYFGTILLAYLSQKYHPVRETLHMRGSRHFFFARTDVFVVIIIFWLSTLSFLRTGYNDSPLSSKKQKNNCRQRYPGSGCPFFNSFQGSCLFAAT